MTKVYCDICGKVITEKDEEYKLHCYILDRDLVQYRYAYAGDNVCGNCIKAINDFIAKNLKAGGNQ